MGFQPTPGCYSCRCPGFPFGSPLRVCPVSSPGPAVFLAGVWRRCGAPACSQLCWALGFPCHGQIRSQLSFGFPHRCLVRGWRGGAGPGCLHCRVFTCHQLRSRRGFFFVNNVVQGNSEVLFFYVVLNKNKLLDVMESFLVRIESCQRSWARSADPGLAATVLGSLCPPKHPPVPRQRGMQREAAATGRVRAEQPGPGRAPGTSRCHPLPSPRPPERALFAARSLLWAFSCPCSRAPGPPDGLSEPLPDPSAGAIRPPSQAPALRGRPEPCVAGAELGGDSCPFPHVPSARDAPRDAQLPSCHCPALCKWGN